MINLLPPDIKKARSYGRKNTSLLIYSGALLSTAVLTASIMILSLQFVGSDEPSLRQKLADSQTKITILEKDISQIENIASRLETADKIKKLSISFSELIPKIGAVLPEGIVLNALSLTGGSTDPLKLDVDLENASLAPVLIKNLVESELFEAADIASLTPKSSDGTESSAVTYSFTASITASFTGTAEAQKKLKAAEEAKKKATEEAAAAKGSSQ